MRIILSVLLAMNIFCTIQAMSRQEMLEQEYYDKVLLHIQKMQATTKIYKRLCLSGAILITSLAGYTALEWWQPEDPTDTLKTYTQSGFLALGTSAAIYHCKQMVDLIRN